MRPARLVTLIFILASLSGAIFGQSLETISGTVVDSNGAGVAGSIVVLEGTVVRQRLEATANASGEFNLRNVPRGRFRISVSAKSFGSVEREITVPVTGPLEVVLDAAPVAAEVSVSANQLAGTPESLTELPGSVGRIGSLLLENSRVFNFSEALRKLSGVVVKDEEGFGLRPNIGLRGTNPTRSTKVLLLEDGLPISYAPYGDNASYYHPPVERFESIEILKGSSQILYGPQTIAGVVNYLTPNPSERPTFSLRLIGGGRGYFNGSFTGSGTIGKTGVFANFTRKQGDGARENVSSRLNDFSSKIVQTINARHALTFKFSYYGEDSNVTYSGLTEAEYAANPRWNPFKNDLFFGDRYGASAQYTGVFSPNAIFTASGYGSFFKRHWWRQSSNSNQRPNRLNVDPDCLSMADLNTTCGTEGRLRQYETYGFTPKLAYSYTIGSSARAELQTGFRVHYENQDRVQENGVLPTSRSGVRVEENIRANLAYSGYIQNRLVIGDLAITPGIRLENIRVERRNLLANPIAEGRTTVNAVIPGLGIAYSGLPRTTVFFGIHRGFSPPRVEDIISNSGGVVELDPELSWNYETGVRTDPFRGIKLEGTFFRLDYENQIVPASLAGGVGATLTNGGRTLQQGIEFSGQFDSGTMFRSGHNVYLRTAVTHLSNAEFRGTRYSSVNPAILITGNRLPFAPRHFMSTSFGYAHPKGFDAFIENVFVGRQFGDDLNTIDPTPNGQRGLIPAQTYWNATANYNVERLRTTFFVTAKNIFDRTFIVDRVRGILPSSPRLVQAGVKIKF